MNTNLVPEKTNKNLTDEKRPNKKYQNKIKPIINSNTETKPKAYDLTTLKEFDSKQLMEVLKPLSENIRSSNDFNTLETIALFYHSTPETHCAYMKHIFIHNQEIKAVLNSNASGTKYITRLVSKTELLLARFVILYKAAPLLGEAQNIGIKNNIITLFLKPIFETSIETTPLLLAYKKYDLDQTNQVAFKELSDNITLVGNITSQIYRRSYQGFKSILDLICNGLEMQNSSHYSAAHNFFCNEVLRILSKPNLVYSDHHYYLQLLRSHLGIMSTQIVDVNSPQFSEEQRGQLNGYLSEQINLFLLLVYRAKQNDKIFGCLPLSKLLNKKPEDFFGKVLSKSTYSLLIHYLTGVTEALTLAVFKDK